MIALYLRLSVLLLILLNILGTVASAQNTHNVTDGATNSKPRNSPTNWWDRYKDKSAQWYASDEAIGMANNVLSWQTEEGGWPLMNTTNEPWTGDEAAIGPWGRNGTLVHATTNEIRFLSRVYMATKETKYKSAVYRGIDFIAKAQTATGGWPKSYPVRTEGYHGHITFNDGTMVNTLALLHELLTEREYSFLGEEQKSKTKAIYDKGIACILKCQIVANGQLTAWAQQHDAMDYQPRAGRSFEPAAISGGESAGVLHFLMSLRNPSPEIIKAIEAGIQWYRDVQIEGFELIKTSDDLAIKANPSAPPLWARFYEIGTNRPIFAGRDGQIKYNLSEVEQERRGGYAWYNYNGTHLFERYEQWLHERKWDEQPPTNTDEGRVGEYSLPDPLRNQNGKRIRTASLWEKQRRAEILNLFEQHQHGRTPAGVPNVSYTIVEQGKIAMGGLSRRTQARITFPDTPYAPEIRVALNIPVEATGAVPTLLHISFTPNVLLLGEGGIDTGMAWDSRKKIRIPDSEARHLQDIDPQYFIERGYAVATVYYGDIEPDFDGGEQYGIRSLFKAYNDSSQEKWGAIGAWAWGISRVVDFLQTVPDVDAQQIALSGVSRLGKTVLWAAAQDERVAMAIPLLSGEGGAAISRRHYGETIADLTDPFRYHYWYAPAYADYAFKPNALPVDGHMLLSLLAPRPVLQIVGKEDTWSDPQGEWVAAQAAAPVYALYGRKGVPPMDSPPTGEAILDDMGFYMHSGGHTVFPEDFKVMADFMDKHFSHQATPAKVTVTEDEVSFTLSNGIVQAKVSKESGDLVSLVYRGTETLTEQSGHPYVYWSHDVKGAEAVATRITIDPAANGGERAEVSIKGYSGGKPMGHGPGTPPEGDLPVDIEIRYSLARADQGVYTYCIFEHRPEYGPGDMSEARIAAKLQPFFSHIHVDDARSGPYPLFDTKTADKYVYTALQAENRAYGFTSPEQGLGWFMIIPSAEFLSGGPTKAEFLAHGTSPTVLSYWKSSHYGGAHINLSEGEEWTRVVGPLLLYVNEGENSESMWQNAKNRLKREEKRWPYDWIKEAPYAHKHVRGEVRGNIIMTDPIYRENRLRGRIFVGLTQTPYTVATSTGKQTIEWYNDAKYPQYWICNKNGDGRFSIPNVPAGTYTLTIFADGVLGEYAQRGVEVKEGGTVDLGDIHWTPVRYGHTLWEIGLANRTASEFAGADRYFEPGSALRFAAQFSKEIDYTIDKSDYAEDWYYAHMPYANDSSSKILPFRGVSGKGAAATRTIHFRLEEGVKGQAVLRIALNGTGNDPTLAVAVNGIPVKQLSFGRGDGALVRHQMYGFWREREIWFDATMLRKGENTLQLTVPAGSLNTGVIYDYIRLELNETDAVHDMR